jgi:hypothetical protein
VAVAVGESVGVPVGVLVAVEVAVAVAVAVTVAVAVDVAVAVAVAMAVGDGVVVGGLVPLPVKKSQCLRDLNSMPAREVTVPLNVTEYLLLGARFSDGVKVAVEPSQTTVPTTRGPVSSGPATVKVLKLIDRHFISTLKVTKTVVSGGTLRCSGPGIEDTTRGPCDCGCAASTFCAPARAAAHMTCNNKMIDIFLMTLSLIAPDALRTETSTAPSKRKRRPDRCESARFLKGKVHALQRSLSA